jgi:hypothetical protein
MTGKQVAGLGLLIGAAAAGFYAYKQGWYGGATGQLNSRQQSLKWLGEQMRYRGKDVDVHEFVDGGSGLTGELQQHLAKAIDLKKVKHGYEHVAANGIGRPL